MPFLASMARVSYNRDLGFNYFLGAEYERKKHKLQEELQMDYKRYIDDQKTDSKEQVPNGSQYSSSLPIAERTSDKEKLREERNREYNLFLQEQAKSRRRGQQSLSSQPEGPSSFDVEHKYPQEPSPPGGYKEHPSSRRDAATITDMVQTKQGRKTWDLGLQRRRAVPESRQESYHSSEDKFNTDSEEEIKLIRRKPKGQRHISKYIKEDKHHRVERASMDMKHDEVYVDQNNNDHSWNSASHQINHNINMADSFKPTSAATRNITVFATGLMIGQTEEQEALQRKKEQYKQELLNQIAEQRENKRKDKNLELKVAATGATEPNKPGSSRQFDSVSHNSERWKSGLFYKPDTGNNVSKEDLGMKHFPDSNLKTEHRKSTARQRIHFPFPAQGDSARGVNIVGYSPDSSLDGYNKDFSQLIGEVATKRVSDVPPPIPPKLENNCKTAYDDAYYYFGSRHPLDKAEGAQEFETRTFPQQSHTHLSGPTQPDIGQRIAVNPFRHLSSESEQRREKALNYHEALKQQIKDEEERRRKEKKERQLYDAKIRAEMTSYNPWGRAGGGAPIKDQSGNLITNLDKMHKTNEESYIRNPNITTVPGLIGEGTPRPRFRPPLPDLGHLGHNDPEHSHRQDRYKEELMQQIKDNRRKQAEEREQHRIREENEEKRLAEERAQLLREYQKEEEQYRIKIQMKEDHDVIVNKNKDHHQKTNKSDTGRKKPESDKDDTQPIRDRTTCDDAWKQRAPSPPVPSPQHKPTHTSDPSPPSVTSPLSSRTEILETALQNQPEQVPVQTQAPQQDDQQEIIAELAALRAILKKEKKHFETELMQTDAVNEHYLPLNRHQRQRRQSQGDSAGLWDKGQEPPSTRGHMQNFREFNQLKYRDTPSREELLYNYPDPPSDAPNLDLQQQALLREQQRTLRLMKRKEHEYTGFLDEERSSSRSRLVHRDSVLPSDTAFLDVYSCEDDFIRQPSAESRQTSSRRRHNFEGEAVLDKTNVQPDVPPRSSDTFVNQVRHGRRQRRPSETPPEDDVDILSLRSTRSARERLVSAGTVATEPWLRTSTAEEHQSYRRQGRRTRAPL